MMVSPSIPATSETLVTLRVPSVRRAVLTMRSSAELICCRIARVGRLKPDICIIISSREIESRGVLAWMVEIDPSWPVFMAWSMSSDSPPRTSPTMMRSGRMRRLLRTRSRCVTSPRPSMLGGRVSSRHTWGCWSWSSAEAERRDDGVHARAVGQARVHHGRAFVDAPAPPRHDAVDDLQQVLVVAEDDRRRLELAEPLDVDLTRGVDQDVGDVRVAHERLDRPEAVDLVQDLLAEPFAVTHAEGDRLLLDEHGDRALQLRGGLVHLDARQVGQVNAVEQLAMDAELQVLVGSVDGRESAVRGAARRRLAAGRGGRPVVETHALSQLHFRASLLNTRCRSPFGLGGGATPLSFAASSAIANERADCLPLSGVPSFIAPLAAASSRGMTRSGSLPIARTASCGLTGPGITCENTGWMSWADTLRRSSSSIRRRAARTPGTDRSVRMRMWSDCSNAASMGPFTVRAVSTTVWENWARSSSSVSSTWSWPTASASSTCVGAGSTKTPRGWRVSVPARKMSSTVPFASAMVAIELSGVMFRNAATSPRCRSRSTSATSALVRVVSEKARLTARVVAPRPPRAPHTVMMVPAACPRAGPLRAVWESLMSALLSSWGLSGRERKSAAPASSTVRIMETLVSLEATTVVRRGIRSTTFFSSVRPGCASKPSSMHATWQRSVWSRSRSSL